MPSGYTTCMATYGSGAKIAGTKPTTGRRLMVLPGKRERRHHVSSVVDHGATTPESCDRRSAIDIVLTTAAATSASVFAACPSFLSRVGYPTRAHHLAALHSLGYAVRALIVDVTREAAKRSSSETSVVQ